VHISGVREATHAPHPHAEDGAVVGATVEAGAGAGAGAIGMIRNPACFFLICLLVGYLIIMFLLVFLPLLCHTASSNISLLLYSAGQDPYLDLLGEVVVAVRDQGALATAGAPCDLPPHLQRSAAARLMEAGARGAPAPGMK
jgi:hypothetical protein